MVLVFTLQWGGPAASKVTLSAGDLLSALFLSLLFLPSAGKGDMWSKNLLQELGLSEPHLIKLQVYGSSRKFTCLLDLEKYFLSWKSGSALELTLAVSCWATIC